MKAHLQTLLIIVMLIVLFAGGLHNPAVFLGVAFVVGVICLYFGIYDSITGGPR